MKTIIDFLYSFSINWPLIWSDLSIYICACLFICLFGIIIIAVNYEDAVRKDYIKRLKDIEENYLLRTTIKVSEIAVKNDELTAENLSLKNRLEKAERKRNLDGSFAVQSGKGHGKKKLTA